MKKYLSHILYFITILFFASVIFLPAVYVLGYAVGGKLTVSPELARALAVSFAVAVIVTAVDVVFGVAFAWVFVRTKSRLKSWMDNLIDLPLIVPTAALGLSVYLFWGEFWNLGKGMLMIILLHIIFTLPYVVRSVAAAMEQISETYHEASSTLGAYTFSMFRTIDFPLFKDGLVVGAVLAFTRSLSETGATLMVASAATMSAPVLVVSLKDRGNISEAAVASVVLIISAMAILLVAKFLTRRKHFNFESAYPVTEKYLGTLAHLRNYALVIFLAVFIVIPTFYIILYNFLNFRPTFSPLILTSFLVSFGIAFFVTIVGLVFAIPMAYFIARTKDMRWGNLLESLHEVVLLVPTSALGVSLGLFWRNFHADELFILALSHLSFTFPLMVKPLVASVKNIDYRLEEAAYSLGATRLKVLRSILFPLMFPALVAGSIMVFMRSLSETGATLAVSHDIKTVSVLIVELVKKGQLSEAGFISFLLFVMALVFLIALKNTKKSA